MNCETFALKYLPVVRKHLVKRLYDEHGMNQTKISEVLDITQPAVSQYISGARGKDDILPQNVIEKSNEVADRIYQLSEEGEVPSDKLDDMMCEICERISER